MTTSQKEVFCLNSDCKPRRSSGQALLKQLPKWLVLLEPTDQGKIASQLLPKALVFDLLNLALTSSF